MMGISALFSESNHLAQLRSELFRFPNGSSCSTASGFYYLDKFMFLVIICYVCHIYHLDYSMKCSYTERNTITRKYGMFYLFWPMFCVGMCTQLLFTKGKQNFYSQFKCYTFYRWIICYINCYLAGSLKKWKAATMDRASSALGCDNVIGFVSA